MAAESSSSDEEKPTAQAKFSPEFSVNKAHDLSNPSNFSNPGNPGIYKSQDVTAGSLFSAEEQSIVKTEFLANFFTEKP